MKTTTTSLLLLTLLVSACKTNLVYINVTNPAPVTISNLTTKVGLINRSIPSADNTAFNTLHQKRAGESLELIKEASAQCIDGLTNALVQNKRFDEVKKITPPLTTPIMGTFPAPLAWSEVETICKNNAIDVLFALEVFDTQLQVVPMNLPAKPITNVTDVLNTVAQAQVTINTTVKTGWRLYDPAKKYMLDEYPLTDNLSITANATNVVNTTELLLGRKEAIKLSTNRLGAEYVNRITPYYTKVTRDYYIKGTYNFKIAMRKARTGNWDGAGELWLKETKNTSRKIAGRAYYNMAILNEINGDLNTAIQWAQQAYENYNNKLALQYVNTLKRRKQLNERANYQLNNN